MHSPQKQKTKEKQAPTPPLDPTIIASSNPYELIKKMNAVITEQKNQIVEYETAFNSLFKEKVMLQQEKKRLEMTITDLKDTMSVIRANRNKEKLTEINQKMLGLKLTSTSTLKNQKTFRSLLLSPSYRKSDFSTRHFDKNEMLKSNLFESQPPALMKRQESLQQASASQSQEQYEYVPEPVRLSIKNRQESTLSIFQPQTSFENVNCNNNKHTYAETMLQDFLVLGPEIGEFKKKRHNNKNQSELTVQSSALYSYNKFYKEKKIEFVNEIARRAYPQGCKLKRKLLDNNEDIIELIESRPNPRLCEDYFIFTLKGDQSLIKNSHQNKNTILGSSNSNYFLYVICFKLPDFIYIRDEKNYHRKQSEVWLTEKIYAISTYYPFFDIYTVLLARVHEILSQIMMKKIVIENENPLMWGLTKNVYDLEKNAEVKELLGYFFGKKADYNQVCYYNSSTSSDTTGATVSKDCYFGMLPELGFKSQYAIALYCCPIFFSNFSYEELLFLLTAIFCQKTIIFLSKYETIATLSALFLVSLISPFQYSQPLLLNCDSERVKEMIFEFPFAMICSIKKNEQNIEEILYLFAESNVMRTVENDAQYIVVDIDSNTILYHNVLHEMFWQCIVSPSDKVRQAYYRINSCESKSFSLPKTLPKEQFRPHLKPLSNIEKREEQKKKYVKEYMQKIATNMTKIPVYKRADSRHEAVLRLLTDYIQSFTIAGEDEYDFVRKLKSNGTSGGSSSKNMRTQIMREYLMEKHRDKNKLVNKFLESQMYANYLDNVLSCDR